MAAELTASELRKTGISVIGDVRWGTHFCHFYETGQIDRLERQLRPPQSAVRQQVFNERVQRLRIGDDPDGSTQS